MPEIITTKLSLDVPEKLIAAMINRKRQKSSFKSQVSVITEESCIFKINAQHLL